MNLLSVSIEYEFYKIVYSRPKSYENDTKITLPQISAKCTIPNIHDLENYGQGHKASLRYLSIIIPNIYIMSTFMYINIMQVLRQSKIENVPRGIRGEKSSKDMTSSRNLVSTIGAQANPTMGDGTSCPEEIKEIPKMPKL